MIRSWTDLLEEPDLITSLFSTPPALTDFLLAELHISGDQDACMFRGTFSSFPDSRLPDWEDDANRLGMHLWLLDLVEFEISGWSTENLIDLTLEFESQKSFIDVHASGDTFSFQGRCRSLHVEKLFAYRTG